MCKRGRIRCITLLLGLLLLCGCQPSPERVAVVVFNLVTPAPTPQTLHIAMTFDTPVPSAMIMPTPTPTPALTAAPTAAPMPVPTPSPTATAKPTSTAKSTAKPTPTATPIATGKTTAKPTAAPVRTAALLEAPTLLAPAPDRPADIAPTLTPTPVTETAAPTSTAIIAPDAVPVPDGYSVPAGSAYSTEEVVLAAKTAYFEARGKGEEAYRAVICVIANRAESSRFGGGRTSIKTEVYRKNQFSVIKRDDFATTVPSSDIIGYANDVLNNGNRALPADVLFFRSGRADKTWGTKAFYQTIGGNDFYYGG